MASFEKKLRSTYPGEDMADILRNRQEEVMVMATESWDYIIQLCWFVKVYGITPQLGLI